jgi:flagellar biosynthesis GTPase FlhF
MTKPTKPILAIAGAACIALSSFGVPPALAKQQCSAAMPSDLHGHWWSYRLIDGRKCWYEGKPGLSKSLLEWPEQANTEQAKTGQTKTEKATKTEQAKVEQPKTEQAKTERAKTERAKTEQASTEQAKTEAKTEQANTRQAKAQPEPKQAKAQPESNKTNKDKERAGALTEKPRNLLDSQAWAPTDQDTFETRWRSRVVQQHPIDPTTPEK